MTALLSIISALDAPPTWAAIPVDSGHDGSWAQDVATALGKGAAVRADLAAVLRETHETVLAVPRLAAAVWVPDPRVGVIAGLLLVDRLLPPPGRRASREDYLATLRAPGGDHEIVRSEAEAVELPAGPALRIREVVATSQPDPPWIRPATCGVTYTVFGPGRDDALELAFVSATRRSARNSRPTRPSSSTRCVSRRSRSGSTVPEPKAATAGDVGLVLPHDWWVIPLQPAASRRRSVERLVRRQFAGIDDQPLLRADTSRVLLAQADRAAGTDAQLLALSLLQVAGVPVPASLVVHSLEVSSGEEPDERNLLVDLEERLRPPPGAAPTPGFALDRSRVASGPVLRRVREQSADLEGAEPHPSLVADYWIERPDRAGLVLLAFATPMVGLRGGMLELFDAIASALHWATESAPR